ncbi:MAG: hypothetical protein KFF68_08645 [Desulfosarcina sp.]|nr:hypothetical protein [Desulfosarcina sp.]
MDFGASFGYKKGTGKRFHAGCEHVDEIENIAVQRARELFGAEYANVQPHSGTSANLAVYFLVLDVGDRVLSMGLPHGGHLSHGHHASITSKCFDFTHYGVDPEGDPALSRDGSEPGKWLFWGTANSMGIQTRRCHRVHRCG